MSHPKRALSGLHNLLLPLSLALAACGTDEAPTAGPADDEVTRLEDELAKFPGELVVTSSSEMPFSEELEARLVTAGKVIHTFSDGRVVGFIGSEAQVPAGVPSGRVFRELHGDIVIADQQLLPDYLRQEERGDGDGKGSSEAVGLPIGNGGQWPESTVAYEIDASFSNATELTTLRAAISSWNTSVDPFGSAIKVRFVPRYWADGRPYVRFVRGGSGGCGLSAVGRHDNIFTNWFSHNIYLDCIGQATIHHEMGHTAGLYHEQQRCDRDNYVYVGNPVGVNCERRCGGDAVDYGPYNYLSVMHYVYSSDPRACSIQQISPYYTNYRGAPWQAGTASGLDTYDVQAINQSYQGRPSLPSIGPGKYYSLVPQYTSKVLAVPASFLSDGVQLVLFDRLAGARDQHWSLHNTSLGYLELRPRHATEAGLAKCMEDASFSTANGGAIVQWGCWGGDNQQWIVAPSAGAPGYFDVINKYSGKSLDVPGWSNTNGALIQQWDHTNGTNQRFQLSPAY